VNNFSVLSGHGQYFSDKKGDVYLLINWDEIVRLVDHPQKIAKDQAQWVLASSLASRSANEQREKGSYPILWCDFDIDPLPINQVAKIADELGCDYELYTSKSAKEDLQKSRLVLYLRQPLLFDDWNLSQESLNDWFDAKGATTDRASERAAQLCYLPNEGDFYDSKSKREGISFDPLTFFNDQINEKIEAIKVAQKATEGRIADSKTKREQRLSESFESTMNAFNLAYCVEEILLQVGYRQRGDTFSHPKSESGSFSTSVKDGRAHSFSTSDPLYTGGGGVGAHDAFSAYCILNHDGDEKRALKDAGDNWLSIAGESWNKVKQREWAIKQQENLTAIEGEKPKVKPIEIPHPLLEVEGVIGAIADEHIKDTIYPDKVASIFSALVAMSAVIGNAYHSPTGLKLNQYGCIALTTGTGKEGFKSLANTMLEGADLKYRRTALGVSRQALHSSLHSKEIGEVIRENGFKGDGAVSEAVSRIKGNSGASTSTLAIVDELQQAFDGKNTFKEEMTDLLMELYTCNDNVFPLEAITQKYYPLTLPYFSLIGFSTPEAILRKLGAESASKGLLGRFMFYCREGRTSKNYEATGDTTSTEFKVRALLGNRAQGWSKSETTTLNWSDKARDLWIELDKNEIEPLKYKVGWQGEAAVRLGEHMLKIASILAISDQPNNPIIECEHIALAWRIRKRLHDDLLVAVNRVGGLGASDYAVCASKVKTKVKEKGFITLSKLSENCSEFRNLPNYHQKGVISQLVDEGCIELVIQGRGKALTWLD